MPIVVPVSQLEPGMCLASNVVNRYSVLLPYGHTLSASNISALNRKFPNKMVQVTDPLLDEFAEFEDDSQDHRVSLEVRRNVATASQKVSQIVRSGVALTADNIIGMQHTIEEMIKHLQNNPVTRAVIEQSCSWDDYLQEHSANVFYLSMIIGNTIRNFVKQERERLSAAKTLSNAMNLTPMATAALLHDIGMTPIERLYQKAKPLTKEEIELIKAHPVNGANMLPDRIDPMVKLVVRSHHENFHGSGYPNGIQGDKIPIFARILRVADAYSAAISDRTYSRGKSRVLALHEMLHGRYRLFYDPVVIRIFTSITQPFPIGAKLRLDTGQIAVVTKHNRTNPFKPEVLIAFDKHDKQLPREDIEGPFFMDKREDIKVLSFGEEDVSFINEYTEESLSGDLEESQVREYNEVFDLAYP